MTVKKKLANSALLNHHLETSELVLCAFASDLAIGAALNQVTHSQFQTLVFF